MAHLDITTEYALRLTSQEFRLIGLSLCGGLPESEREEAKELNVRLQMMRAKQSELSYQACKAAMEKAVGNGESKKATQ